MSRLFRVSLLTALALGLAAGAYANIPDAELSEVPDCITFSPGGRYPNNPIGGFLVNVQGPLGAVEDAVVEVEIGEDADVLIAWCVDQDHFQTGMTDANGDISFEWFGGSCLDPDDFFGSPYISQVRADGIVLDEPAVSSPDAVNNGGRKATDTIAMVPIGPGCEGGPPATTTVGLADAVFHTRPIKEGLVEKCTKYTPPFDGPVGLDDAVAVTPYIKNSNFCDCQ